MCISDGCGSSASICCDRHTYCNCVTGDCGFCIDLGVNLDATKYTTNRYAESVNTFSAIYKGDK